MVIICAILAIGLIVVIISFHLKNKGGHMPQGVQIKDESGNTVLDTSDRVTRILTTDVFPYSDSFTRTYTFPEFESHAPFVICSSFNVYTTVTSSIDVYLAGNPLPSIRNVWYQITWELNGTTLTLKGQKSDFTVKGSFGTATIRTNRISQPPFQLIIGVY